jgi:hypothetical protein
LTKQKQQQSHQRHLQLASPWTAASPNPKSSKKIYDELSEDDEEDFVLNPAQHETDFESFLLLETLRMT